jgi:hypothetical protein
MNKLQTFPFKIIWTNDNQYGLCLMKYRNITQILLKVALKAYRLFVQFYDSICAMCFLRQQTISYVRKRFTERVHCRSYEYCAGKHWMLYWMQENLEALIIVPFVSIFYFDISFSTKSLKNWIFFIKIIKELNIFYYRIRVLFNSTIRFVPCAFFVNKQFRTCANALPNEFTQWTSLCRSYECMNIVRVELHRNFLYILFFQEKTQVISLLH